MTNNADYKCKNILVIDYRLFLAAILLTPLYLFKNRYIKLLGSISIVTIFLLTIISFIYNMGKVKVNKRWFWFIVFSFYSLILLIRTPTIKGIYSFLLQILLLFLVSSLTSISLDQRAIEKFFIWGKFLYFVLLVPAGVVALEGGRIAFMRFNKYFNPVIYKIMLPCTFFFIPNSRYKLPKILFFSFVYFRMVERTSSIVLIVIYIVYLSLKKIKESRRLYNALFVGVVIILIGFTYGYVLLQYTEVGHSINNIFRKYTGGNFFSGRNIIWKTAFDFIKESPILGYGLDNGLLSTAGIDLSAHNTYIHLLLQGGIVGLLIFLMFMYTIWESYFDDLDDDITCVAAAYLIGILIFINFEITLIGNSVVTSIFLWLILSIGNMQSNRKIESIKG